MMALVSHQVQGSYAASRPLSIEKGIESKNTLVTFPVVKRTNIILLKQRSYLCVKAPLSNRKPLKISSFKGNIQNDESVNREKGSKSTPNPVKLSYVPKDHNKPLAETESSKVKNDHATSTSNTDESTAGSVAIQQLFRSWLTLLRTPSQSQLPNGTLEDDPLTNETVEMECKIQKSGTSVVLKAVWSGFLGLDPAIKMPPIIFIPMYLAVTMKYGPKIAQELTPLWICGPLLVALYIKIIQGLCFLYIYSFKQSSKLVKNVPVYYNYVLSGNLKETIRVRLWLPVANFRNLGYKEIWNRVREWMVDKYLDYIESIWPHYCKLIRFLKRANFI